MTDDELNTSLAANTTKALLTNHFYSQTKWSVPLKIALMNWLFKTWTR